MEGKNDVVSTIFNKVKESKTGAMDFMKDAKDNIKSYKIKMEMNGNTSEAVFDD